MANFCNFKQRTTALAGNFEIYPPLSPQIRFFRFWVEWRWVGGEIFDPTQEDRNSSDNTSVYLTYGEWLNDVESRTNPNYQEGRKGRNSQHLLAHALKVTGYPSLVFFKDNGDLIQTVVGYKTPEQLEIYLKMIVNDDYLKLTTGEAWQEYQENFKGTFK